MTKVIMNIPVAIAGGGPVGLMLALYLDHYGVRSVIFSSLRAPSHRSVARRSRPQAYPG